MQTTPTTQLLHSLVCDGASWQSPECRKLELEQITDNQFSVIKELENRGFKVVLELPTRNNLKQ